MIFERKKVSKYDLGPLSYTLSSFIGRKHTVVYGVCCSSSLFFVYVCVVMGFLSIKKENVRVSRNVQNVSSNIRKHPPPCSPNLFLQPPLFFMIVHF